MLGVAQEPLDAGGWPGGFGRGYVGGLEGRASFLVGFKTPLHPPLHPPLSGYLVHLKAALPSVCFETGQRGRERFCP